MPADFETFWVSRIGRSGAEELRRFRQVGPLCWFGALGCLLIGVPMLDSQPAGGLCLVAIAVVLVVINWRRQVRLAQVLSDYFGVRLRSSEVNLLRADKFDAWAAKRGLTSHSSHS
jgi:hypothetical protein